MIDFDRLQIIGEYRKGQFRNLLPHRAYHDKKDYGIYLIRFADGQMYVGTSNHLYNRVNQHFNAFKRGNHILPKLTKAFNENSSFYIYLLAGCNPKVRELSFLYGLRPNLNTIFPADYRIRISELEEVASIIGCTTQELIQDLENRGLL